MIMLKLEINVPSGKLIASDDFRSVNYFDVDSPVTRKWHTLDVDGWAKAFTEKNVAYAFVGNTCPAVTKQTDGSLAVVSLGWNELTYKAEYVEDEVRVASICTDLWGVMLTDYQNWLDHGGPDVKTANEKSAFDTYYVIDVEPGTYEWIIYSHDELFDFHSPDRTVFAELKKKED